MANYGSSIVFKQASLWCSHWLRFYFAL